MWKSRHLELSQARIPEGIRVYAVGDVHGRADLLEKIFASIDADLNSRPAEATIEVFLGDYIDRGPDSAGVVDTVMRLQSRLTERVIALRGNHEAVALEVIDGEADEELWLREGGTATLRSYGVARASDLPREHVAWMRSLPLHYDDGQRFFVHAGIDPDKPLHAQSDNDLIWIREPFLSDARDHGRLIVHGHTPQPSGMPDWRGNRRTSTPPRCSAAR